MCLPLPEPINEDCPEHGDRRIQACVNACAGIPTEQLEAGSVAELVDALEAALKCFRISTDYSMSAAEATKLRCEMRRKARAALAPFQKD